MGYKVALDDGHGMETAGKRTPPIPELGGRVIHENEFNREVVKYLKIELERCGLGVVLTAPTDADTSLSQRVKVANDANVNAFVSVHYNAYDGEFDDYDPEGISVHYYPTSSKGKKFAQDVLEELLQGTSQKNRGVVASNFYVLRETKMPAILSENGFMDNKREAMLMVDENFQREVAKEHAKGICKYLGVDYVPYNPEPEGDVLYRVQTGAFSSKQNAENLAQKLEKDGYDTYMVMADGLYKVQAGAFANKSNAKALSAELESKGYDTFITTKSGTPVAR